MTLKEKVGQMTQLEIGMVTDGQDANLVINPDKLRKAVVEYGVGAILNVKDTALTLDKWHELIGAIQQAAAGTRLKIPIIYGIDTIHGANYVAGATLFPQPLGMAATWDPELMKAASEIAAKETRAAGIPWNFSPVLDIGRQPLWPRLYETFGEDPHLASVMGAADRPRLPGGQSGRADLRRGHDEALRRLQLPVQRPRPDAGAHSRHHDARVLPADVRRRREGGRAVGHGELRRRQRHARPPRTSTC